MTSLYSHLHDRLKVTSVNDGEELEVTITLSTDYFHLFLQILDSLTGFVHTLNKRARLERRKSKQSQEFQADQIKKAKSEYHELIGSLFDQYTEQGLSRYEAIKQIGADLRAKNHPWSSPDLIRPSLRECGRVGRPGRPRRQP